MNRADMIREVLVYEQIAAAAKDRAAVHRRQLEAAAAAEYAAQGAAPTWRMPGLATATLGLSSGGVAVADSEAFTKWVAQRYPSEVETVQRVRASFMAQLPHVVEVDGEVVVDAGTGEVVPGVAVKLAGVPRSLSIRPSDRDGVRGVAEDMLSRLWAPAVVPSSTDGGAA